MGHFLGLKNAKTKKSALDFSGIICDNMFSKGIKIDCFFSFKDNFDYAIKNPSSGIFGYKIGMFRISRFIALFFGIVSVLQQGVFCYFVFGNILRIHKFQ